MIDDVVRMYFFDDRQHHVPHVHAEYAGDRAVFSIADGELLAGHVPPGKTRVVQAWIEIHGDELRADWDLAVIGEPIFRVEALR